MSKYRNFFAEFHFHENSPVELAVDKTVKITRIGTVIITVPSRSGITNLILKDVLYVSELKYHLLSTSKATANNNSLLLIEQYAKIS